MVVYNIIEIYEPHNSDINFNVCTYTDLDKAKARLKREVSKMKNYWFKTEPDGYQYCEELEYENIDKNGMEYSCCTEREDYFSICIEETKVI